MKEEDVKSLKASLTAYKSANTKQRAIIEELKKKNDALVKELNAMAEACDEMKEVNTDLKAALDRSNDENATLKKSIEVLQKEIDKAHDMKNRALKELEDARIPWWKKLF